MLLNNAMVDLSRLLDREGLSNVSPKVPAMQPPIQPPIQPALWVGIITRITRAARVCQSYKEMQLVCGET